MLRTFTTFAATIVGKLVIATSIVAAAAGGTHAAGVLDVPILPDTGGPAVSASEFGTDDGPDIELTATTDDTTTDDETDDDTTTDDTTTDDETDDDSTTDDEADDDSTTDDSTTDDETDDDSTTDDNSELQTNQVSTHPVLEAGSVTINIDGLNVSVESATPNEGWTIEIETEEPHEAGVNFRRGDDRIDFRAEIEDGQIRIRIRDRRSDTLTEETPNTDPTDPTNDDETDDDGSSHDDETDDDETDDDETDDDETDDDGSSHDDETDDDHSGSSHE